MKLFFLCSLLSAALLSCIYFDYISPGPLEAERTVILPRGSGFTASVDTLAAEGIIAYPLFFKAIAAATGDARRIKAGEYLFPAHLSPREVVAMLIAGKVVVHKLTVAEGLSLREIMQLLSAETILEGDIPAGLEEGQLLPETYHFTHGETRAALVARMRAAMQETLAQAWEKRAPGLPLASPQEALILASIVEKETGLASERPRVAGVFTNRLKRGMMLQSDPTVAYGLGRSGRDLTTHDLRTPTPYNTYMIPGLPPAPIASPGNAAIEAALNPAQTDDLYFVAIGDGSGGHRFAATLVEHNKNVAAYRLLSRKP